MIDIDLLIVTDRYNRLFLNMPDILLCHNNRRLFDDSEDQFKPVWATVFGFRKSAMAQDFFELVGRIERNWHYYRKIFGLVHTEYRNDYAFAMAELIINGHSQAKHTRMPWSLLTIDAAVDKIDIGSDWMVVRHTHGADILPRVDLHVMSKAWLQSSKLDEFIEKAMA